jgi:multiple sugar transport system ATP-binding protein
MWTRATAMPQVFLMDEPLSNLDAKSRLSMRAQLKHVQKRLQTPTVYVTHDQIEAMTLADQIAIMNKGKIQQLGTPDEIIIIQPICLSLALLDHRR